MERGSSLNYSRPVWRFLRTFAVPWPAQTAYYRLITGPTLIRETQIPHLMLLLLISACGVHLRAQPFRPQVPKVWDEAALKDWATPLAGLNLRPTHMTEKEYYSRPVWDLATYPVYYPGHEPAGYWEMLRTAKPVRLIEREKLKTEADWIEAGRRVFHSAAQLLPNPDPSVVAAARNPQTYSGLKPYPDGTVGRLGWVPTADGIGLTGKGICAGCHDRLTSDGGSIPGVPFLEIFGSRFGFAAQDVMVRQMRPGGLSGSPPFVLAGSIGMRHYQAYATPWRSDASPEYWQQASDAELAALRQAYRASGGTPRWNGSLHYPAKTPDLIGIKDRKYIDATGTHLNRGIGDLMRYAALITSTETVDFGPHRMLAEGTKRYGYRWSDEALYALALYIYSLKPPPNPNPFDAKAQAGQKIFEREGCVNCHRPPLYTNNKLTLAKGLKPPPSNLDVLPISVGTDQGLALKTRKGTGYYKVPSLRGVWYRGRYLHDGSVASLEEMFNPDRVKDTHVPGGFIPAGLKTWAIQGHEFGLKLDAAEREQLIAFLRTL